jgi:hypothetical protein
MKFTLESRNALRADQVRRRGVDCTIPESTRDGIVAIVERCWHIQSEEYNGSTLILGIVPRLDVSSRKRAEAECELSRVYGNPPHTCATTFEMYRFVFVKM